MTGASNEPRTFLGAGLRSDQVSVTTDRRDGIVHIDAWGSLGGAICALYVITTAITAFSAWMAPLAGILISVVICQGAALLATLQVVRPWLRIRGTLRVRRAEGEHARRVERVRGVRGLVPTQGLAIPARAILVIDRIDHRGVSHVHKGRSYSFHRVGYRAYALPVSSHPAPTDVWGRLCREAGLSGESDAPEFSRDAVERLAQLADAVWAPSERAHDAPLPDGAVSFGTFESNHVALVIMLGFSGVLNGPVIDTTRPPVALAARVTHRPRPIGLEGVGQLSLATPSASVPAGAVSLAEADGGQHHAGTTSSVNRAEPTAGADPLRRRRRAGAPPNPMAGEPTVPSPRAVISGIRRKLEVGAEVILLGSSLLRTTVYVIATFLGSSFSTLILVTVYDLRGSSSVPELIQLALTAAVGYLVSRPRPLRLDAQGFTFRFGRRRTASVRWREIRSLDDVPRGVLVTTGTDSVVIPTRSDAHKTWLISELESWVGSSPAEGS